MAGGGRDRVTVDLRGAGAAVQQRAAGAGLTVAAFVRRMVLAAVEADGPAGSTQLDPPEDSCSDGPRVKVTLRLPAGHALLLARRSRRADVSQGDYVAGLLVGAPPSPDRRESIVALARATDQLAVISTDLNAFMRLVGRGTREQLEPYRGRGASLLTDLRDHLDLAGRFLADLQKSMPLRAAGRRTHRRHS